MLKRSAEKMNPRVVALADRIGSSSTPFDSRDSSLLDAHEIIAEVRIQNFKPLDEWVQGAIFGEEDVSLLRSALLQYIEIHSEHESRGLAYWGLSALMNREEVELLKRLLEVESSKECIDEHVLWQLVAGLDNLEEDILDGLEDEDMSKCGKCWAASKHYLARHPQ